MEYLQKLCIKFMSIVVVFLLFFSFACNSSKKDSNTVTIKYSRWGTPSEIKITQDLIKIFQKQHPNIKIDFQSDSWTMYWTKLQTQIAGNTTPDVFLCGVDRIVHFQRENVIRSLQSYIDSDSTIDMSDFFDAAKQIFVFNGEYYALPRDINTIVMAYNKDLFDSAGIPYPTKDWTWDDLVQNGQKIMTALNSDKRPGEEIFAIQPINDFEMGWGNFVFQNGGEVLDPTRTKCLLNTPQVINAMNFLYCDLSEKYKIAPTYGRAESFNNGFSTGRLAMDIIGSWSIGELRSSIKSFRWDIVELPGNVKKATIANSVAHVMSANTKHPEEAWEFIKFLSGKEAQILLAKSGTSIPVLKSVAYSDVFLDGIPENKKVVLDSLSFGRTYPVTIKMGEWLGSVVVQEIDLAVLKKKSMKQAMNDTVVKVNEILRENAKK